jgi:hypothetical protein
MSNTNQEATDQTIKDACQAEQASQGAQPDTSHAAAAIEGQEPQLAGTAQAQAEGLPAL